MKNLLIGLGVIILVAVGGFYTLNSYIYEQKQAYAAADYKDAEYIIGAQRVRLTDGLAETEAAPGSASKITTAYFGNEVRTDLNEDGKEDVVFLLTQQTGGSGTFYYAVAALNTDRGYVGSEALLLGDRIAPQTTEVSQNPGHKGVVVINYADRAPGEPMTTQPSVGKSIWLKLDPQSMQFGEVAQNFEGESDPSTMTLTMKTWAWQSALYNDGRELKPAAAKPFTITFAPDGKFTATTDCNAMGGSYTADAGTIAFSNMYATKMFCENSLENDFTLLLRDSAQYHFTSKGELILNLKFDSGSVVFK